MSDSDKSRKQMPLRLSQQLFDELTKWAEDDFRSLNGQIEFLLTEAVKKSRKKNFGKNNGENNAEN